MKGGKTGKLGNNAIICGFKYISCMSPKKIKKVTTPNKVQE